MVKVMYNERLVYNEYIWVVLGITFGKENEALSFIFTDSTKLM